MSKTIAAFLAEYENILHSLASPWVDAGSYKGEFVDVCLELFPEKEIHAFEPIPKRAGKLRNKYAATSEVNVHARALGESDAPAQLNVTVGNPFSSLLSPLDFMANSYMGRATVADTVDVEQVRLDTVLQQSPGFMKLDVQGYELPVLQGCGAMLHEVGAVFVEMCETKRYNGESDSGALHDYLEEYGLKPVDVLDNPPHFGPSVYNVLYLRHCLSSDNFDLP